MVIEAVRTRSGDPAVVTDPVMSLSGDLEEMGPLQSISLLDILTDRGFGLIRVKEEGWTGFSESNQPKENPVLSDSFTQIYILQGFFCGPPFKIVGIFV